MNERNLQKLFLKPLVQVRAWAHARGIEHTSIKSIYDHFLPQRKCACCNKPTNWGVEIKSYREFCSLSCVSASKDVVARRRATNFKRHGFEEANLSPKIQAKKRATFIANYGVDNPSKVDSVKVKKASTMFENFGAEHWTKVVDSHFATDNPMQYESTKEKIRKTNLKKYGTVNPSQCEAVKLKIKNTHFERYGATNIGHIPSGYRRKKYVDRFGIKHIVQGYEPQAIEWLEKRLSITRIVSGSRKLPSIRYVLKEKEHFYHPDLAIYTNSSRHLIEVKSTLTIRVEPDRLQAKFTAAQKFMEKRGGNFWVLVVDKGVVQRFCKVSVQDILKFLKLKPIL